MTAIEKDNLIHVSIKGAALFLMILTIIGFILFAGNASAQIYKSDMMIYKCQALEMESEIILDERGYISIYMEEELIVRAFITDTTVNEAECTAAVMAVDITGEPYIFVKKERYILFDDGDIIILFMLKNQ